MHCIWDPACLSVHSVHSVCQPVFLQACSCLVPLLCAFPWHWPWYSCLALRFLLLASSVIGFLDCALVPRFLVRSQSFVAAPFSGLCGGAPSSVDFSMLGASFSDPAPDLSFEPLPNLGNTCWLASVTRLLHTCDLRLPCAMPSWRETVDHMSALGFHDGGQKDPRVFLAAICALYPQWTQDSLWSFNRTASCSVCLSARLIPSDGQFVVDLGLPSDLPTSVSDLISDVSSPVDSHLDCVTCGRVRHVLGSPSPAAHLPFVLFHIRRAVGGVKSRSIVRVPNRVSWFGRIYQLAAATIHIGAVPETASVTLWLLLSIAIGICNRMLPCWLTSLFLIVLLCLVTRCRSLFLVIRLPAVPCSLWLPILLAGFLVGLNF